MEEVAGMDRRVRQRPPDGVEERLVPAASDGPLRVTGGRRASGAAGGEAERAHASADEGDDRHDGEQDARATPSRRRKGNLGSRRLGGQATVIPGLGSA